MPNDVVTKHLEEKRSEPRITLDQPYSVEINLGRPIPIFQLKLRDISGHGSCILVQENSSILNHLNVGQELKMKYWTESRTEPRGYIRAQVKHISKPDEGAFRNHYLIGMFIQEKHDLVLDKSESGLNQTDNGLNGKTDRRQANERRESANSGYVKEKRSGQDRRSGLDRRAGVDRRTGVDRRSVRSF